MIERLLSRCLALAMLTLGAVVVGRDALRAWWRS
jgi:hypothetical protein